MIAMTRPVAIAKMPIQSHIRGAGAGSLAACEGSAAAGRCGAPIVGAAVGNRRRGRRALRSAGISAAARSRSRVSPVCPGAVDDGVARYGRDGGQLGAGVDTHRDRRPGPEEPESTSLPELLSSVENPGFPRGCARLAW
jgi:hypothetical protein